jgi:hypothetical protein
MRNSELLYPLLLVTINGLPVERQPSAFRIMTDQAVPAVLTRLSYPADVTIGVPGDTVTVSLMTGNVEHLLFTGEICGAATHGAYHNLSLTDSCRSLYSTFITPAYRKEKASIILQDTLETAGITETKITCPPVTLQRFSTGYGSADRIISLLIRALGEFGETGLRYFFDAENVFHFGKKSNTGKTEGEPVILETGKDIIARGDGWIEILPAPIRHSQAVTVDGVAFETVRTDMVVSRVSSRLVFWVNRGAA